MRAILKGAVVSGAGALLLGASLALSSATVVSGAIRAHPDNSPVRRSSITCTKSRAAYCFTVTNNGTGNAIEGHAQNSGLGVHGIPFAPVSGIGVLGESTTSSGLAGMSTSGTGVYGFSTNSYGVFGDSTYSDGVYGLAISMDGVYGASSSGNGVYGTSSSGSGVYGYSTATAKQNNGGVYGLSPSGYGVNGQSPSGYGVYGQSSSGIAGIFGATSGWGVDSYSKSGISGYFEGDQTGLATLEAVSDASGGYPFAALNDSDSAAPPSMFYVDPSGDGFFSGYVTATAYKTAQRQRNGAQVGAFSPESTQATIEDTGTSRLLNGEGTVRFDQAFASAIDPSRGYQIFLTPNGDTRGLYVSAKYEGGFIVRENEHGRSSVYFDYRVVAHPYGTSDARLPQLNLKPPSIPHLSRHLRPRQS
jgi:hypothetical protein